MKVKSQEDQKFWSLKFSDVMWKPAINIPQIFTVLRERLWESSEAKTELMEENSEAKT